MCGVKLQNAIFRGVRTRFQLADPIDRKIRKRANVPENGRKRLSLDIIAIYGDKQHILSEE